MNLIKKNIVALFFLFTLVLVGNSYGQNNKAPIDAQLRIIPKVLSLDKALSSGGTKEVNLAVLYSSLQRNSEKLKIDIQKAIKGKPLSTKKIKINTVFIDMAKVNDVNKILKTKKIRVAYIAPMRGIDIDRISGIFKKENILSITGVLDFMSNDISIGFDIKESRIKIIINNKAAKSEGSNFSSRLLRIAKLI